MVVLPGTTQQNGVTPSERYLAHLCENSFFSLWSHPNVFKKRNKELCDLLVVFGDNVIVFSDKSCTLGSGLHAWSRWYRRSIAESVHQLHQAARWLRSYPGKLFLDPLAQKPFPFEIRSDARIHLVAVALGAADACRAHRRGGSGSLSLGPGVPEVARGPFCIGDVGSPKDFVHVFDDVTLNLAMRELNTIADFVEYLSCKQRFIRDGGLILADGEEDLLGYFLTRTDPTTGHHDFILDPGVHGLIIDNFWTGYSTSNAYVAKHAHNQVASFWDAVIETLTKHHVEEARTSGDLKRLADAERCLRLLAREPRIARRSLSKMILGALDESRKQPRTFRHAVPGERPDMAYAFIILAREARYTSEEHYRQQRMEILLSYCEILKSRNQDLTLVLGLGFGCEDDDGSIDFVVCDFDEPFSAELLAEVDANRRKLGLREANQLPRSHWREEEYPDASALEPAARSRADSEP